MDLEDLQDHMEDRIIDLKSVPEKLISRGGFEWYLHQEYIVPEAILLIPEEIDHYIEVANAGYDLFQEITERIIDNAEWERFDFPLAMREMIQHSWDYKHMHLLSRFDLSGGIDGLPTKIFELNADTPTMLPETVVFQQLFKDQMRRSRLAQFNRIRIDLKAAFKKLLSENPTRSNTLLVTSLGYDEDVLNAQVIMEIAKEAGFEAEYADLELVIFEDDGVYLDFDDGSDQKFDFLFKLVPWEFIMYEEPELLGILRNLQLNGDLYIINPAYTAIMQSKAILPYLHRNSSADFVLKSSFNPGDFSGEAFVEKVVFGRLGENITVIDRFGSEIARNDGDFGQYNKIYQAFAPLYQDEDGDHYQPGIYCVDGNASSISFRRCENIIVDDDSEFIPHFIEQ